MGANSLDLSEVKLKIPFLIHTCCISGVQEQYIGNGFRIKIQNIVESSVGQCWYNQEAIFIVSLWRQFMITLYISTNQIYILIDLASVVTIESVLSTDVCWRIYKTSLFSPNLIHCFGRAVSVAIVFRPCFIGCCLCWTLLPAISGPEFVITVQAGGIWTRQSVVYWEIIVT